MNIFDFFRKKPVTKPNSGDVIINSAAASTGDVKENKNLDDAVHTQDTPTDSSTDSGSSDGGGGGAD